MTCDNNFFFLIVELKMATMNHPETKKMVNRQLGAALKYEIEFYNWLKFRLINGTSENG